MVNMSKAFFKSINTLPLSLPASMLASQRFTALIKAVEVVDGYSTKLKDYLLNGFQHGFLLDYVGPHKIIYPLLKTLQPFPINCQKS